MPESQTPSKGKLVHTFENYGPDFEIKLTVTVNSWNVDGQVLDIFDVSSGCHKGQINCRNPKLVIQKATKAFKLFFTYDMNKHEPFGEKFELPNVELNIPYEMVITHENGLLTWTVNSNLISSLKITNPRTFHDMKVYMTPPFNDNSPFDGTISDFEITTNPGMVKFILDEPFTPPLERTTLATFKTYGPEFEINFGLKFSAESAKWIPLVHMTNGSNELGGRYPFLLVVGEGGDRKFLSHFYESADSHDNKGHKAEYLSSDLDTITDFSFTYKKKVFQWFVNGQQSHMIKVAEGNGDNVFENMKIWIGDGKNQIPGKFEYFTLSADGSYEGKIDFF